MAKERVALLTDGVATQVYRISSNWEDYSAK